MATVTLDEPSSTNEILALEYLSITSMSGSNNLVIINISPTLRYEVFGFALSHFGGVFQGGIVDKIRMMTAPEAGGAFTEKALIEGVSWLFSDLRVNLAGLYAAEELTVFDSSGTDALHGGTQADVFHSQAGNDEIYAGAGADTVHLTAADIRDPVVRRAVQFIGGEGLDTVVFDNDSLGSNGSHNLFGAFLASVERLRFADGLTVTIGANNFEFDRIAPNVVVQSLGASSLIIHQTFDKLRLNAWDINGNLDITIKGTASANLQYGNAGSADHLLGLGGADWLRSYGKADVLEGGLGKDTLEGGAGADVLIGGAQDDRLLGGDGVDRFVFSTGFDSDRIGGFDAVGAVHDRVDLRGLNSVTGWGDLRANHLVTVGTTVELRGLNGDRLTLEGVRMADLDAGDFMF